MCIYFYTRTAPFICAAAAPCPCVCNQVNGRRVFVRASRLFSKPPLAVTPFIRSLPPPLPRQKRSHFARVIASSCVSSFSRAVCNFSSAREINRGSSVPLRRGKFRFFFLEVYRGRTASGRCYRHTDGASVFLLFFFLRLET